MKQTASLNSFQRAFTMVMAVLFLVFALFFLQSQNTGKSGVGEKTEHVSALTSFQGVANLPSASDTLPKLTFLFSLVTVIGALMLLLALLKIRRHLIVPVDFFLLKINFVFVSTQAP